MCCFFFSKDPPGQPHKGLMRQQCELLWSVAGTGDKSLSTVDFLKGERIQSEKGDSSCPVCDPSASASSKNMKPKKAIKLNENF